MMYWKARVLSIEYWETATSPPSPLSILERGNKARSFSQYSILNTLFFVLLALLLPPLSAHAQSTATLQTLTVSLLPQYDDPRLMIVLEADLNQAGTSAIAIPNAVELTGAEAKNPDGTYTPIEAAFEGASDGRFITFTSPTSSVRLVFYQDAIPRQPERNLTFTLPAQRDALTLLKWRVVFPLGAKDIRTTPEMTTIGAVHYGMEGFEREAGALPAYTTAEQQLAWVRDSNSPSFAQAIATPATTTDTPVGLPSLPAPLEKAARSMAGVPAPEPIATNGWLGVLRRNPVLWGGAAVFVLGLLLVVDGLAKQRRR
jgi:hypothetical protein